MNVKCNMLENDDAIRDTLHRAKVDPKNIGLKIVNENERDTSPNGRFPNSFDIYIY